MTDFIANDDDGRWDADRVALFAATEQRSWENHGDRWPEANDDADPPASQPCGADEIGEFQPQARQKSVVGWQRRPSGAAGPNAPQAALSLLFVDISLQRSA